MKLGSQEMGEYKSKQELGRCKVIIWEVNGPEGPQEIKNIKLLRQDEGLYISDSP